MCRVLYKLLLWLLLFPQSAVRNPLNIDCIQRYCIVPVLRIMFRYRKLYAIRKIQAYNLVRLPYSCRYNLYKRYPADYLFRLTVLPEQADTDQLREVEDCQE